MVNEIIPNQMPTDPATQDSLNAAAKAWRVPYWDWAAHNEVPILCQNKNIDVTTKFGTATIKNPMYQYDLPAGKTFGTMGPGSNQNYVLKSADGFAVSLLNTKTSHLTEFVNSGSSPLLPEDAPRPFRKTLRLFKQAPSTTRK